LASVVAVTDTLAPAERSSAPASALDGDIAVLGPGTRVDHAVVTDARAQDTPRAVALRQDPDRLLERFGPVLGVGDAIWRALSTVSAEIVCVASEWPLEPGQIECLTQPLIDDATLMLVSGVIEPHQGMGDRLTELVARPLVARYEPALAGLRQPLLGSFAARRSLLRAVPFPVGAGMRLSLLLDAIRGHGRDAVAEVALQATVAADRPLRELGADAAELIVAVRRRSTTKRAIASDRLVQPWNDLSRIALATGERPPFECVLPDDDPRAPGPAPVSAATPVPVAVIVVDAYWSRCG
jgi:glucosyl-3-phosphoglycerate synthase